MRMLVSLISSFALACVAAAQTPPPNRKGPPAGQFSQPHGHAVGKPTITGKPTVTGHQPGVGKQTRAGKGKPITTPVPAYNATHTTGKSGVPAKTPAPAATVRSTAPAVTQTPTATPLVGPQGPLGSATPTPNPTLNGTGGAGGAGGAGTNTGGGATPTPTPAGTPTGIWAGRVLTSPTPTPAGTPTGIWAGRGGDYSNADSGGDVDSSNNADSDCKLVSRNAASSLTRFHMSTRKSTELSKIATKK
jgi:hypothetical protein